MVNKQVDPPPHERQIASIPPIVCDWLSRFPSSGLFFMIVGAIFLWIAFNTMGRTHAGMSFVFVVVGVAILLYGTGTQGIGHFDSGERAEQVARYKIALAGGAGVMAFSVAAGIIGFSPQMKNAFQIEQRYLRLQIHGKGYAAGDISLYIPDITINGTPVPAVRRGDFVEVYVPYMPSSDPAEFEISVKLHPLGTPAGLLKKRPERVYNLVLETDGNVTEGLSGGKSKSKYKIDSGYDFPRYSLKELVELVDDDRRVAGIAPQ